MTTNAQVGAPAGSEEDPTKKNITAPPILKQAEEAITQNIGAPASKEDRDRIFAYRAEPYQQQTKKTTDNLSKYFEQQGLRFSTERRDMIGEKVAEIGRQMGESVMVPQIEREKADQQAWASLGINLGTAQANIAQQDRRQALDEVNSAMDRAAAQARETGVFKDPVTGQDYDTLAAQAQKFGQGIEERQTTLMETNAAYERAQSRGASTGVYIDPVTGISSETLDKQRLDLQKIVDRATATGWWEEEATIARDIFMKWAGADTDNGLGDQPGGTTPPPGGTTPPPGDDPDTVKDRATANAAEMDFMTHRLPQYLEATGAPLPALQALVTELGIADAEALLNRLIAGEPITIGELKALTLTKHQSSAAFMAVADFVTADGAGDEEVVRLLGGNNTERGVINAQNEVQGNMRERPAPPAQNLPPAPVDPQAVATFNALPDAQLRYLNGGPTTKAEVAAGLASGEYILSEGGATYPWSVLKRDGTEIVRFAAALSPGPSPPAQGVGAPAPVSTRRPGLVVTRTKAGGRPTSRR